MKHKLRWIATLLVIGCAVIPMANGQLRAVPLNPLTPYQLVSEHQQEEDLQQARGNSYDPANPDLGKLQQSADALAGLPFDKKGAVDWMTALRSGAIQPRADLSGSKRMDVLDLDVILKNTKEMPYVKFPHNSHTQWLACSNCHDQIFVPKAGANEINMTKIFGGEFCGVCHGKVAFLTLLSCERCHSIPHGETKAWW